MAGLHSVRAEPVERGVPGRPARHVPPGLRPHRRRGRRARLELRRLRHRAVVHPGRRQQEGRVHPRPAPEGGRPPPAGALDATRREAALGRRRSPTRSASTCRPTTDRVPARSSTSGSAPSPAPTSPSTPTTSSGGSPGERSAACRCAARGPRSSSGPQDGLFTVTTASRRSATCDAAGRLGDRRSRPAPPPRSRRSPLPTTTLVTLTVTEKGYELDGPGSAAAVVAAGLDARRTGAADRSSSPRSTTSSTTAPCSATGCSRPPSASSDDLARWIADDVALPPLGRRPHGAGDAPPPTSTRSRGGSAWPTRPPSSPSPPLVGDRDGRRPPAARRRRRRGRRRHRARTSGASSGCSTGPTRPSPTAGCWPAARRSPRRRPTRVVAAFVRRLVDDVLEVAPPVARPAAFAEDVAAAASRNPALGHTCRQVGGRRLPEAPAAAAAGDGRSARPGSADHAASPSSSPSGSPRSPGPRGGTSLPPVDDPAADELRASTRDRGVARLHPRRARPAPRRRRRGASSALERVAREVSVPWRTRRDGDDRWAAPGARRRASRAPSCEAQLAGLDLDGRSLCLVIPDATRQCPLPLLLGAITERSRAGSARASRSSPSGTHAPMNDEAMRSLVGVDGLEVREPRVVGRRHLRPVGDARRRRRCTACPAGCLDEAVDDPGQPPRRRERRHRHRRAGPAPRGHRLLRRRQVPVPRPVGPGAHRRHPLARRPDHQRRDHRQPRASRRCGRWSTPPPTWSAASATPCASSSTTTPGGLEHARLRRPRSAVGGGRRRRRRDPTSCTSTRPVRRVALARRPAATTTCGPGPRASTRSSRSWPTAARSSCYAPHITQIAATHPGLDDLGYHCRDYFLAHWDEVQDLPRGELAHSTHLFGAGTYDPVDGEHQRVRVTLATGIPEAVTRQANLGYLDPASVDVADWEADPDALVVPDAGEVLYRLRTLRPRSGDGPVEPRTTSDPPRAPPWRARRRASGPRRCRPPRSAW